jgi:pyruvate/2-oxoglutarate dehydrogenase complex dihydrolipoamide acyltransferase (E2) component
MIHTSARTWAPIVPVKFPRTSESINDGQILEVSVSVGQRVEMDTQLLAIATDKASS